MATPLPVTAPATEATVPATMTAVTQHAYGSPEVLVLRAVPRPAPAADEVLIRVDAAGLDRGTWHVMAGLPRIARLGLGLRRPRQEIVGRDVTGTVVEVGGDSSGLIVGQRVFGAASGSFAQYARAKADRVAPAPTQASAEQAAVMAISGLTALQALDAARVDSGHRVLVIGASGGVGSYVVQLAAARGAVVTAVCSARKSELVRGWGAQRVLDYAVDDVTEAREAYDAIIDIAGGTALRRLRRVLTSTGTIVFVGNESGGDWTGGLGRPLRNMLRMALSRQRYVMLVAREAAPEDLTRLAELVDEGALTPQVHAVFPLEQVREAMTALVDGAVAGKVAIRVAVN